jgi:ABC-2 type transport system permease protein
MRNIWTIAKREYDHYFISPIAYVVAFILLFTLGIYFTFIINYFAQSAMYGGGTPDITPINWLFVFLLLFTTPAITMRSISDEARTGTLELLLTAPLRDAELVIGKWLGAFLFVLTVLAVTLVYAIIMNSLVTPGIDQRQLISSYLGVILAAAAFLALGVGISAVFTNQIAAFFATFGIFFILWYMMGIFGNLVQGGGAQVFQYLNINAHFSDALNAGVINLSDLVYFFSLIALGLFTGTTAVEIRRWR